MGDCIGSGLLGISCDDDNDDDDDDEYSDDESEGDDIDMTPPGHHLIITGDAKKT